MASEVTRISNAPASFEEGGFYPGGKGVIEKIGYRLHDYGGTKSPDSALAVIGTFQPKDGSNEGKPVDLIWSCGSPKEYVPDRTGGFLLPVGQRKVQSKSSNWHQVLRAMSDNCGMPDGSDAAHPCPLDGDEGILALVGTTMVLTRQDQRERDIEDDGPSDPNKKKQKRTILVPTWAEFPWEKGAKKAAPKSTGAAAGAAAAAANGAAGAFTLDAASFKAILSEGGGAVTVPDFRKRLIERLTAAGVPTGERPAFLKQLATMYEAGEKDGWMFDKDSDTVMATA